MMQRLTLRRYRNCRMTLTLADWRMIWSSIMEEPALRRTTSRIKCSIWASGTLQRHKPLGRTPKAKIWIQLPFRKVTRATHSADRSSTCSREVNPRVVKQSRERSRLRSFFSGFMKRIQTIRICRTIITQSSRIMGKVLIREAPSAHRPLRAS